MTRRLGIAICGLLILAGCRMDGPPPRTMEPTPTQQNNGSNNSSNNASNNGTDPEEIEFREFDLGCPETPLVSDAEAESLPTPWEEEALAQTSIGHSASFDLAGEPLHVTGETSIDGIGAPMTFYPPDVSVDHRVMYFANATVGGKTGTLVLEGAEIEASAGALSAISLSQFTVGQSVRVRPIVTYEHRDPLPLPEDWSYAGDGYRFAGDTGIEAEGLVIDTYARGIFVPDEGEFERLTPGDSITLEGTATILASDLFELEGQLPDALALTYDTFGIAGDFTDGELDVDGIEIPALPVAMFGVRGDLVLEDGRVRSGGEVFLTQIVDDKGFLIPSEVEIAPSLEVEVPLDSEVWVRVHYREKSFKGDAALAELQVDEKFAGVFEVATGGSPLYVDQIIDMVKDAGWAAPIVAIPAAVVGSIVIIIDVFRCLFGGCNDDTPDPYPAWMTAGAVGSFELKVKGALDPGVYETWVDFVGRNHCPVRLPVKLIIQ